MGDKCELLFEVLRFGEADKQGDIIEPGKLEAAAIALEAFRPMTDSELHERWQSGERPLGIVDDLEQRDPKVRR